MGIWWSSLSGIQQVLWGIAVFATAVFLLQTLVTLLGIGGVVEEVVGEGLDIGGDDLGQGFDLAGWFSLRSVIAFLLGLSWVGLGFIGWGWSPLVAIVIGALAGAGTVALNIWLLGSLAKLRSAGNIRLENAVGTEGTVSLAIPPNMTGSGKVTITIQQRLLELEAVTEGGGIARGRIVTVIRMSGDRLVVRPQA